MECCHALPVPLGPGRLDSFEDARRRRVGEQQRLICLQHFPRDPLRANSACYRNAYRICEALILLGGGYPCEWHEEVVLVLASCPLQVYNQIFASAVSLWKVLVSNNSPEVYGVKKALEYLEGVHRDLLPSRPAHASELYSELCIIFGLGVGNGSWCP